METADDDDGGGLKKSLFEPESLPCVMGCLPNEFLSPRCRQRSDPPTSRLVATGILYSDFAFS
jgi:hypothetical protein